MGAGKFNLVIWYSPKNKLKERQYELSDLLKSYDRVDDKFSKKLIGLMNISSKAYETFKASTINGKRELLNFIFANLELKGRKLRYTLAFPFSEFEKVNNCTTWRGLVHRNLTNSKLGGMVMFSSLNLIIEAYLESVK